MDRTVFLTYNISFTALYAGLFVVHVRFDVSDNFIFADAVDPTVLNVKARVNFVAQLLRHNLSDTRAAEGALAPAHTRTGTAFDAINGGDRNTAVHGV